MTIQTSPTIGALAKAMLQFQGATDGVKRNANNPHFKTKYASLESVIDYARGPLQDAGLVFTQAPGAMVDGSLEVTTRITHAESGEWQQSTMHIPLAKRDPQGAGSALTYAQRYSLMAALGLPPTDDDAEDAYDRPNTRQQAKETPALKADPSKIVIADTMCEAMQVAQTQKELADWQAKQQAEINDLDEVNKERVLSAARNLWRKLPKVAA